MTTEEPLLIDVNLSLDELLKTASRKELDMLVDIITDKGKGRISLRDEKKFLILNHKEHRTLHLATKEISQQICAFGGNTLINLVRTGSKEYQEVARDVAEKLGAKVPKSARVIEIEEMVIQKVLEKTLKDEKSTNAIEQFCILENIKFDRVMLEKLKKQNNKTELALFIFTAAGPYIISHMLRMALMSGLGMAFSRKIIRDLLFSRGIAMLNPIFAALSAVWMTYDLSGPAYRVTLPAVICIATIRQEWIKSMTDFYCLELKKCL
ncbi:hypothetical protein AB6D37_11370 [Pectobacterium brasiliense]|uniref:hypothetical protein n=1 Tax=Pectobacterium brasiliense TaxID=180957 RepID=UPI003985E531